MEVRLELSERRLVNGAECVPFRSPAGVRMKGFMEEVSKMKKKSVQRATQ